MRQRGTRQMNGDEDRREKTETDKHKMEEER